jgi:hypothetical protein
MESSNLDQNEDDQLMALSGAAWSAERVFDFSLPQLGAPGRSA